MIADSARVNPAWDDLLERDDQVLVLAGSDVTLLSPLASAAALYCVSGAATVAALCSHLVELFGTPDGSEAGAAVREVLIALQERGVVSITE